MTQFKDLPTSVQEKVKKDLLAYSETSVWFEYGEYHVSPAIVIKSEYASDHEVIGTYTAKEVYTDEERIINYIETFHDYPIEYKVKRDYRMLNEIGNDWSIKFKMVDGNLIIA